jgi:PAS domain S-box-containing protein
MAHPSKIEDYVKDYMKKDMKLAKKITKYEIPGFFKGKKAEEKARLYVKGFDSSPNSMLLVSYENNQACIVHVNPSFTKFYGYSEAEVIGKSPGLLKSGELDAQYYKKMWDELLNPAIGYWRDEITNKRKDGSLIDVSLTINTLFDKEGKPDYFIASHLDVTDRKKAEKELKKKMHDLEIFHKAAVGRELKMKELKERIAELEAKIG